MKGRGEERNNHQSSTKPLGIKNNNQPTMEDKGNYAKALRCSGGFVGVAVAVARRVARAVLRVVAVAVVEKQQSTKNEGQRQQHKCLE